MNTISLQAVLTVATTLVVTFILAIVISSTTAFATTSPNVLAGDGIPNSTQDYDYGNYGGGESSNEFSGDGIQNNTQR